MENLKLINAPQIELYSLVVHLVEKPQGLAQLIRNILLILSKKREKMNNNPIGIFDSGIGGLSIWKEITAILPDESTIYFADSANCPYGSRSAQEIINLSIKIVDFFLEKKCKLIVIACNSATAVAIDHLRQNYEVPFIGIEPAVKTAALQTQTGNIGVLATQQTFKGRHFTGTSEKYCNDAKVHIQVGNGLVDMAEAGEIDSEKSKKLLKKYIAPMLDKNIDKLVLGCTHYPFFNKQINELTDNNVEIINPAIPVAKQTKVQLIENNLQNSKKSNPSYKFYTNGNKEILHKYLQEFFKTRSSKNISMSNIYKIQ